jgi:hypothetical protein
MKGISTMTSLTKGFKKSAAKTTAKLLRASLNLIVADTRQGVDPATQKALKVVQAHSAGHAGRQAYLENFAASAGNAPITARSTASAYKM